jgi:hypothetical protein
MSSSQNADAEILQDLREKYEKAGIVFQGSKEF